jgi:membrane protein YdbS with pleckstrin-like domain
VRTHPVRVVIPLAVATLLLLLAFFLLVPFFSFGGVGAALFLLLLAFAVSIGVRSWVLWRGTFLMVTNQRVIDVDRTGLFRWVISDVTYQNIADIAFVVKGPLQALCRAGNVLVSTISGSHSIEAHFVPNPGAVREAIVGQVLLHRKGEPQPAGPSSGGGLGSEDARAVEKYAEHLKKRRAMRSFLDDR